MKYGVRKDEVFLGADVGDERGSIDLGEDEEVLATDFRGANRVVFLIGTPVDEEHTCGVNGCSRVVDGPEDTCWQH